MPDEKLQESIEYFDKICPFPKLEIVFSKHIPEMQVPEHCNDPFCRKKGKKISRKWFEVKILDDNQSNKILNFHPRCYQCPCNNNAYNLLPSKKNNAVYCKVIKFNF